MLTHAAKFQPNQPLQCAAKVLIVRESQSTIIGDFVNAVSTRGSYFDYSCRRGFGVSGGLDLLLVSPAAVSEFCCRHVELGVCVVLPDMHCLGCIDNVRMIQNDSDATGSRSCLAGAIGEQVSCKIR